MRFIQNLDDLQLDIVGFLAILGEGSVMANSQVMTLSKLIYMPRLLPAPQALLRPSRPSNLVESRGWVTGVSSGNHRDHINHVAHLLLDDESMPQFSVRMYQIERVAEAPVKAKTRGPLLYTFLLGIALSISLLVLSIVFDDGMALLATLLLSFLSTVIGFGNKWELKLPTRKIAHQHIPPSDVVIRYPKGSFLVIKCDEKVARELYFAPEEIVYTISHPETFRLISLVGTVMLMGGVIALGNATVQLQIGFAASYMLINAAFWIVAAVKPKMHWDLTTYKVTKHKIGYLNENGYVDEHKVPGHEAYNDNFTQAMWTAIALTGSTSWVQTNHAVPRTAIWDQWLRDAEVEAQRTRVPDPEDEKADQTYYIPKWDPSKAWSALANPSNAIKMA